MDRNEFLKKLEKALGEVPEEDKKEILYDYEEHFRNANAAGKTEAEIIDSLGDPESIAKQYLAGNSGKISGKGRSILYMVRSSFAKIGSGLVNLSERITRNNLTFGLGSTVLFVILAFEIFTLIHQNQILEIQRNHQYQNLVAVIKEYQQKSKFNTPAFTALLEIADKAKYNREAIKYAGYIIANVQFNTLPVLKIAKLAGNANHEVRHLEELLTVTITYGDESLKGNLKIVELAKQAIHHEISEAELEAAIKYYRDHSPVKTIEEAEKKREQAFENL